MNTSHIGKVVVMQKMQHLSELRRSLRFVRNIYSAHDLDQYDVHYELDKDLFCRNFTLMSREHVHMRILSTKGNSI